MTKKLIKCTMNNNKQQHTNERFKDINDLVLNEQRSGHPSTSKTEENVKEEEEGAKMVRSDRRLTFHNT